MAGSTVVGPAHSIGVGRAGGKAAGVNITVHRHDPIWTIGNTLGNPLLINLAYCIEPTANSCTGINTTSPKVLVKVLLKHTLWLSSGLIHHTGAKNTVNKCTGVDYGLLQAGLLAVLKKREAVVVATTPSIVELLTLTRGGVEEVGRNGSPAWARLRLQRAHFCVGVLSDALGD